jgi:mannose-1-phosphate guanylyltransferase/phosphomannomutase
MKGVILAGGFGTRLRPLTYNAPKPMVPIINVPIMEHNINLLKKNNIKEIIVILYYQSETIKNYFKDGHKWGVNINYHKAESDFGTAGAVRDAGSLIGKDDFIIISADLLTDFDLRPGIKFAQEQKAPFTIFLTSVTNPLDYGIVIHNNQSTITKFLEKPAWGQVFSDQINSGIYVVKNSILEEIPEKTFFDFSKDLFPKLMDKKIKIKAYIAKGYWRDIGNISEYKHAHRDILRGYVKLHITGKRLNILGQDVRCDKNVVIKDNISFVGTVIIGENSFIDDDCKIENSVIGKNVKIGKGVVIKNSIIWNKAVIGKKSRLHENIIGYGASIGRHCYISEEAVVSDLVKIGDEVVINPGIKIWPEKTIENGSIVDKSLVWGERWNKHLFGNYGVTGIANLEIHPEFAAKLGSVYGTIIGKDNKILLGRDAHKSSRMISRAFITGLLSVGVNVDHLSDIALPVLRYQLKKGMYKGGVFIRMSPIDTELMDIKFYDDDGFELSVNLEKSIERLFFREDFIRMSYNTVGNISYPYRSYEYYREGYENYLNVAKIEKKLSVVIDYSAGLTSKVVPSLIGEITKNCTSINGAIDENRTAYKKEEYNFHLTQMSELVKNLNMDAGFLIDNCGESFALVDEKGKKYENEKLLILLTYLLLEYNDFKRLVLPVNTPKYIHQYAKRKNVEVIQSPVALKFLGKKAREIEADFVGTVEGAFMFPGFNYALDGIMAISKIITIISRENIKLSDIWKKINYKYKYVTTKIPVKDEFKGKVLRELYEALKDRNIVMIDGIKCNFPGDGWICVIPDSDKPCFNLTGEYTDREEWNKHLKKIEGIIKKAIKS